MAVFPQTHKISAGFRWSNSHRRQVKIAKQPINLDQYTAQLAEMAGFLNRACSFTGHRPHKFPWHYNEDAPGCVALKQTLTEQITALVDEGYTDFLSRMALGVDMWATQIVLDLKKGKSGLGILGLGRKSNPLKLHCILPCEGQEEKRPAASQKRYRAILEKADSVVYVNREYSDKCMLEREQELFPLRS